MPSFQRQVQIQLALCPFPEGKKETMSQFGKVKNYVKKDVHMLRKMAK